MGARIIIRMPNWVGDLVMATPVLSALRDHFPNAEITAMCQESVAPLLAHDADLDALFQFTPASEWEKKDERKAVVAHLREGHYDVGILLTNSFSSAWWFWRGEIKRRIGFRGDWRNFFLTDSVPRPRNTERQHMVWTYQELLVPLGISPAKRKPRLRLLPEEISSARQMLGKYGIDSSHKVIGINPGAAFGSAKCWPPERFASVIEQLTCDAALRIILFGSPSQIALSKQICSDVEDSVLNLAGATSLRELMALLVVCDVLLTNDSGPMHIAAALGVSVVALFGSTNAVKTGPYGQEDRVIHKHVECSPCYLRTCPIDFRCMKRIEVDEVVHKIYAVLEERGNICA